MDPLPASPFRPILNGLPEVTTHGATAENDHSLEICAVSAAVSNAVPSLKERAQVVTVGARGAGVAEFISRLLNPVSIPP